jgi:hemerythrin-like domain-containing protein
MSKVTGAIHEHHQKLLQTLTQHAEALSNGKGDAEALAEFLEGDLIPHAVGEERHLYPLVGRMLKSYGDPTGTMIVDHEFIRSYVDKIAAATTALRSATNEEHAKLKTRVARLALQLRTILELHLEKEERVYLPLLEKYAQLNDQEQALHQMHEVYQQEKSRARAAGAKK